MTNEEKLDIIKAYLEGNDIEFKPKDESTWYNKGKDKEDILHFDFTNIEYRIKPKKRLAFYYHNPHTNDYCWY